MNKGIDRASGNWLYFMGADDVLSDPSVLSKVAAQITNDHQVLLGAILMKGNVKRLPSDYKRILWIKNTIHHQGVFYNKDIFVDNQYDNKLEVLADYKLNLNLYKNNISFKKIDQVIAICGNQGISKNYRWSLYKEEISLKVESSHKIFWLFFFKIAVLKFLFKKL